MTKSDGLFGLVRDVLLFREHVTDIKEDLVGLSRDVVDLAKQHALLDQRIARVEGFIEGAAATAPRRARLTRN